MMHLDSGCANLRGPVLLYPDMYRKLPIMHSEHWLTTPLPSLQSAGTYRHHAHLFPLGQSGSAACVSPRLVVSTEAVGWLYC